MILLASLALLGGAFLSVGSGQLRIEHLRLQHQDFDDMMKKGIRYWVGFFLMTFSVMLLAYRIIEAIGWKMDAGLMLLAECILALILAFAAIGLMWLLMPDKR